MKKFEIRVDRVRVDFGSDTFYDCEPPQNFLKSNSVADLSKQLASYIKERHGQMVEFDPTSGSMIFDTLEMTFYCTVIGASEKEMYTLSNNFNMIEDL